MILLVISHTPHYSGANGEVEGWASTVQEINELAVSFTKIYHVACLHKGSAPKGMARYARSNIQFIPIPPAGGAGLRTLTNILVMPVIIWKVFLALRKATVFQFRAPTSMGVYMIPLLSLFTRKKGWFKYGGDWQAGNVPATYAFQRFWLAKLQRRVVTINGKWPGQPRHCLSFENPCLTDTDLDRGNQIVKEKSFSPPFNFVFIGRLDSNKGPDIFLKALEPLVREGNVGEIHVIGDGPLMNYLQKFSREYHLNVYFHGFLERMEVFEILLIAHILVLPSASEGFPKVLAEAWNFGCLPVVSQVSAIDQYVQNGISGVLIGRTQRNQDGLKSLLADAIDPENMYKIVLEGRRLAPKFTYSEYRRRLFEEVIES